MRLILKCFTRFISLIRIRILKFYCLGLDCNGLGQIRIVLFVCASAGGGAEAQRKARGGLVDARGAAWRSKI